MRSSALVHLGNASLRVGRGLNQKELLAELKSSTLLPSCELLLAHLDANGVDLREEHVLLGPSLELDATQTRFQWNERANELLAGRHRAPFVLPQDL